MLGIGTALERRILEIDRISKHVKTNVKSKTNLHPKPRIELIGFRFAED